MDLPKPGRFKRCAIEEWKAVDKLRVGVVGVGALGQHHARVYASLPNVTLIGVADTRPGRAEAIAGPLGAKALTDYRQLIGKVDAVSIATPTTLHADIGAEFLEQGANVLVEKPISNTLEGADKLIRAAANSRRILQIGHLERFNPAIKAVRQIVREPRFFEAHRMGLFTPRSLDIDVILDLMIHDLDVISLLVPFPPVQINAVGIAILTKRIDIANARIQFANGCIANITASRVSMEKIRKLRFFQRQEYVSVDYTRQDVSIFGINGAPTPSGMPEIIGRKLTSPKKEPLDEELKAFLSAAQGQGPVECTGEEGKNALAIALQILAQAEHAQAMEFDRG
jgi:predicted dehydrogenase